MIKLPTLRSKLISIILVVTLVGILAGVGILGIQHYQASYKALENNVTTLSRLVADYTEAPLTFNLASDAQEFLDKFNEDYIMDVVVLQPDRSIFARYVRDPQYQFDDLTSLPATTTINEHVGDWIYVHKVVGSTDDPTGSVHLKISLQPIYDDMIGFGIEMSITVLIILFISYFLADKLQSYISRPIYQLSDASKEITASKNYSLRLPSGYKDEMGDLCKQFNRMLEAIELRERQRDDAEGALKESKRNLESVVKDLEFMANFDGLTGLANRALCMDRIKLSLLRASRDQYRVAVLFLDLDHFKDINDSLGHAVGDELLKEVSLRLKSLLRQEDTLARLGGDEFVIVLDKIKDVQALIKVVEKVVESFSQKFQLANYVVTTTFSIGIAVYPNDGTDVEMLMKNADTAMYKAKELGRNTFQFYEPEMNALTLRRLNLANDLRSALKNNEFELVFQPQLQINTETIVGVETLLRWKHGEQGYISPAEFIPIAESTGLMDQIGAWVLEEALVCGKRWQEMGYTKLRIAVNLSAVQFRQKDLPQKIHQLLLKYQFPAKYLELELTESLLMRDVDSAIEMLVQLKKQGIQFAIDDFGTGYSSLSYLRKFPIDALKIDRSFVDELGQDMDDTAITLAIISMAKNLRLKVIAEGVEKAEQKDFLLSHDCDEIQGFWFSPGVPAERLEELLTTHYKEDTVKEYSKIGRKGSINL